MGSLQRTRYIWTLKDSTVRPTTHYSIELWAFANYDLGESLALMMGFLEPDPDHPGQTRIVVHNTIYSPTGNNTQGNRVVSHLDTEHVGIMKEDFPLGGVRLRLNISILQLLYIRSKTVVFDMGAWTKHSSPTLPYLCWGIWNGRRGTCHSTTVRINAIPRWKSPDAMPTTTDPSTSN